MDVIDIFGDIVVVFNSTIQLLHLINNLGALCFLLSKEKVHGARHVVEGSCFIYYISGNFLEIENNLFLLDCLNLGPLHLGQVEQVSPLLSASYLSFLHLLINV